MPKNEDGEFELILGNRQLLSVFFIVVVLLGVFFTMGYIVGRNSGPLQPAEVATARKDSKPLIIDSPAPAVPDPKTKTPVETKPQQAEPEPEPVKKAELARPKLEQPRPVEQPAGSQFYLQLTATSQHEAEVYVDVLKKKDFKAITAAVPEKPGLYRVLVGPMAESAINKAKADLKAAGFPGDQAIKRSF